ncbi:LIC_10461 domain-containing protein [Leptospira alstonii]|uniref:Uncharacterized protein n=2 Tax=Leptospira alstonii TaxID=28452 RepID=M6CRP3_9LEPT|nr:hypothetical protein [Leptospira alstonii]EMJ93206.1 hypothetical protein LEP1GSC194_1815 [Leptospira alstonii serovar Sichuan str. 79601]EQA78376.1 hypothetical protein LEP1GSC193_4161 [Leptospira alstonii serovar Pingchang str. 80-412]
MFRKLRYAILLSIACFLFTCYRTTLQVMPGNKLEPVSSVPELEQEFKQGNWILGLFPAFEPPLLNLCTNGKPQLKIQRGILDHLIHWTIGGLYTVRTVQIYCSKEKPAAVSGRS